SRRSNGSLQAWSETFRWRRHCVCHAETHLGSLPWSAIQGSRRASTRRQQCVRCICSTHCTRLEENPQAEFQLPRRVGLARDHTERRGIIDVQAGIGRLKMIQDIHELEAQGSALALREANLFRYSHVKVPSGKST